MQVATRGREEQRGGQNVHRPLAKGLRQGLPVLHPLVYRDPVDAESARRSGAAPLEA